MSPPTQLRKAGLVTQEFCQSRLIRQSSNPYKNFSCLFVWFVVKKMGSGSVGFFADFQGQFPIFDAQAFDPLEISLRFQAPEQFFLPILVNLIQEALRD